MVAAGRQFKFPCIPMLVAPPVLEASDAPSATITAAPKGSSFRAVIAAMLRDTPSVTFKLARFYGLLFCVIRPLVRMKNPFRNGTQVCAGCALACRCRCAYF